MVYTCNRCGYKSARAYDLLRHENRKTQCVVNTTGNDNAMVATTEGKKFGDTGKKFGDAGKKFDDTGKKFDAMCSIDANVASHETTLYCTGCNRFFLTKKYYEYHVSNNCKGHSSTSCAICRKEFTSVKGRWAHNKNVKCQPPPPPPSDATPSSSAVGPSSVTNTINNNNNNITNNNDNRHITTNTDSFNTTNNNSVNIHLNFGEEALEKLCSRPEYMDRMRELIQLGKYALPQQISDIYFNDEFPMNNTIMKQRHNDRFVKIKTGENEWNLRAIDDVYTTLTNKMESYMQPYFKEVEKRMERIYDEDRVRFKQLTRSVREFGHKVLWLDWQCEDIRHIGVNLNDPYCDTERKRRIQEMKAVLLEHIYDKTREHLSLTNLDSEQDDAPS